MGLFNHKNLQVSDIKSYSKEGKVHCYLVFSHMPEPFVCHVVFHLSKNCFRFYTSPSPMPDAFFRE